MPDPTDFGPVVRFPERIDRRTRLGPFPSARDAAKFLCYAAAGALLAPWVTPFLWLPLVATGFAVAVWQPDGRPADERAWVYLRWKARVVFGRDPMSPREELLVRRGIVRLAPSCYLAVLRATGCPLAYLPPAELAEKFARFRDLLRSILSPIALHSTTSAIRAELVLPATSLPAGADREARDGYAELARLLCDRRRMRRVYVVLRNAEGGSDSLSRLEAQASSIARQLSELGVHASRLRNRDLAEAVQRLGWSARREVV